MKKATTEQGLITTGLVLFIGLALWMILRPNAVVERFPPLSSYSPRPNGALALYELLARSGMAVDRHLLSPYDYPDGETVAVLEASFSSPGTLFTGGLDAKAASQWMKRGGTLVFIGGADSFELESLLAELREQALSPLESDKFGLGAQYQQVQLAKAGVEPVHATEVRAGTDTTNVYSSLRSSRTGVVYELEQKGAPLLEDVGEIEASMLFNSHDFPGMPVLQIDDPPQTAVAWIPVGEGAMWWIAVPEIASNGWINRHDNHKLLLAVFGQASQGRTIWFDERRHGYHEQGPDALGMMVQSPGGRLLLILAGLCALAFIGGAVLPARYLPPPAPPRRQSVEMVLAQGNLYQRAGLRRPIAEHLLDGLRMAVHRHERWSHPPDDRRLGEWLHRAAASGLPVDSILLQVVDGKLALGTERQLWLFARACDQLRNAL